MQTRKLLVCARSIHTGELQHSTLVHASVPTPVVQSVGLCRHSLCLKKIEELISFQCIYCHISYLRKSQNKESGHGSGSNMK